MEKSKKIKNQKVTVGEKLSDELVGELLEIPPSEEKPKGGWEAEGEEE